MKSTTQETHHGLYVRPSTEKETPACTCCPYVKTRKVLGHTMIEGCTAAEHRFDIHMESWQVDSDCPLARMKMGGRAKAYVNKHPSCAFILNNEKLYPAEFKNGKYTMLCTEEEGVIEECDSNPDEDCHDCWDKGTEPNTGKRPSNA